MMKLLKKCYDHHFLLYEGIFSFIIAIIIIVALCCAAINNQGGLISWFDNKNVPFFSVIASIAGNILGFLIATLSILIGFCADQKFKEFRESESYHQMYIIFIKTIVDLSIITILSIIGILTNDIPSLIILGFLIFPLILAAFRIGRCIWILKNITEIFISKNTKKSEQNTITTVNDENGSKIENNTQEDS